MRHAYDYEMHSPLNSPFHSDGLGLNYSTDLGANHSTAKFEKKLILHYVINHSLQFLLESYSSKLEAVDEQILVQLIKFTASLFKRLQLSLSNFQKLVLLLNRYFTKIDQVQISLKQVIVALLIKIVGHQADWSAVTGLPLNTVTALERFVDNDLDPEDYEFSREELDMINDKMKTLIYSRFDVI